MQVKDFDVHDVPDVFKDFCPNFVLLQLIILLHSLLLMINMLFLMKYFKNPNFLRWMRKSDNVNRGGCRTNKHARNGKVFEVMTPKNLSKNENIVMGLVDMLSLFTFPILKKDASLHRPTN